MMKKYTGTFVFIIAFLVFIGLVATMLQQDRLRPAKPQATIAVVVYGDNVDRWRSLDQGIRQACAELGIEKPILNRVPAGDAARQIDRLAREVSGGAKGLLVAAANSEGLSRYLEETNRTTPVVLIESGAGSQLPCVSGDDAAMARLLAENVAGLGGSVAVLKEGMARQNNSVRFNAFVQRMAELGAVVDVWSCNLSSLSEYIASTLAAKKPDILVALDNETLEIAVDAIPASMVDVQLCGVGASEKVVHALDVGGISALCYMNEYAMGYQATMQLAEKLGLIQKADTRAIQYGIATRQTLYTPAIEHILFPITQ